MLTYKNIYILAILFQSRRPVLGIFLSLDTYFSKKKKKSWNMLYIIGPLTSSKLEANSSNPCMCIFILPRQISNFWSPPPCGKGWTYQLWQWLMNLCNMLFFVCSTKKKKIAWCPATFLLHSQLFNRGPCFSLNFAWIPSVCVCRMRFGSGVQIEILSSK